LVDIVNLSKDNYYSLLYNNLIELSKERKIKKNEIIKSFIDFLNYWMDTQKTVFDEMFEEYTENSKGVLVLMDLIFNPILSLKAFKDKTYETFNINIDFLLNMHSKAIADDNEFALFKYTTQKNGKVKEFYTKNGAGIIHIYNSDYILTDIEFACKSKLAIEQ
jgi:hypothetical protein